MLKGMFSLQQKREIAAKVEAILLEYHHPEMPTEKPRFSIKIEGIHDECWAVIFPNWIYEDGLEKPTVNVHNELQAMLCRTPKQTP